MLEFLKNLVTSSFINSWTSQIRKDLKNVFQLPDFTNEKFEVQRHYGIYPSSQLTTGWTGIPIEFSGFLDQDFLHQKMIFFPKEFSKLIMIICFNFIATSLVPPLSSSRDILPLSYIDFKQVIGTDLQFACVLEVFFLFLKDLKVPLYSLVLGKNWRKTPPLQTMEVLPKWTGREENQLLTKTFMWLGRTLKKFNQQSLNDKMFWIFHGSKINVKLRQWNKVACSSLSSSLEKLSIRLCKTASGKPILDCK